MSWRLSYAYKVDTTSWFTQIRIALLKGMFISFTAEARVGEVVHTPLMSANRKIQLGSCVWRFVVVDRSAPLLGGRVGAGNEQSRGTFVGSGAGGGEHFCTVP
jgi:hypothetical protein